VDIRYFRYQFASLASDMHALGQGSTFQELSTESLSAIRLACPPELEQRAIADFLDDETVRIDALIAAKRRMLSVLEERRRNSLLNALRDRGLDVPRDGLLSLDWSVPPTWRVVRLSQVLVQLTNGYVGPTRDILVDEGVRYVQSLHIKGGKIDFDRSPYFVQRSWHDERPRIHLRPDDVLVVQTGDIGQVAVVPNDFGEASCHALQILRARRDMVSGEFLGGYLRSPIGYQSLLSMATGALHPHLEGSIRAIPVILPPLSVQVEVLREVAEASASMDRVTSLLARQIDLLVERRQALITSAVTGELEIPGVAA
jgi:type I restriction enzyme S subunit